MLLKFCGLRRQEDVTLAARLGATHCGFVFHAGSPRCVDAVTVSRLESGDMVRVGVFTGQDSDEIARIISEYNAAVEDEEDEISYTDYVAILMSSVSTIINAISYVLIAFVAISLVVSSIMIGIITYISVLERTKEIGILRSIGASKRDVSNVFNAETLIEGFAAGVIGMRLKDGDSVVAMEVVDPACMLLIAGQGAACMLYVGTSFVACAIAGQMLLGAAFGMVTPLQNTLVQIHAPLTLLGRVNSVMNAGFNGAGVVPLFAAPVLAEMFGVQGVLVGASFVVLMVPVLCLVLMRERIGKIVAGERVHDAA